MSNFSISVGGRPLPQNAQLNQVKDGVTLEEAKQVLAAEKDNQDTIGLQVDGVDYLISGVGIDAQVGDEVIVEGQAVGTVAFIDQEENTFTEGFKSPAQLGGLEHSVAGAPFVLAAKTAKGAQAALKGANPSDEALKKVTQGPPITPELVAETVDALESFFD